MKWPDVAFWLDRKVRYIPISMHLVYQSSSIAISSLKKLASSKKLLHNIFQNGDEAGGI